MCALFHLAPRSLDAFSISHRALDAASVPLAASMKNNSGPCCVFPGSWAAGKQREACVWKRERAGGSFFPSRAAGQALWLPRAFMVSNKLSYKNPSLEFYFSKEPGPAWKLGISISYFLTGQQMQEKRAEIQRVLQILPLSLPKPASEGSFPGCGELVLWDQLSPVSQGGNLAWNGSAGHRESSLTTEGKSGPRVQTKRGERLGRHLSTPFFSLLFPYFPVPAWLCGQHPGKCVLGAL